MINVYSLVCLLIANFILWTQFVLTSQVVRAFELNTYRQKQWNWSNFIQVWLQWMHINFLFSTENGTAIKRLDIVISMNDNKMMLKKNLKKVSNQHNEHLKINLLCLFVFFNPHICGFIYAVHCTFIYLFIKYYHFKRNNYYH